MEANATASSHEPAGLSRSRPVPSRRITVAMVTFNAATVVERALASVARHHSPALELVVVDGASTDATVSILRRYEACIDRWISEPDSGIYAAMNKALRMATGDWLLFLGADDELLVSAEQVLERFTRHDAVYYGDVQILGTDTVSGGRFSRYRLMQENICHQAIFYPRLVYTRKNYDTASGMMADHRYNIELWGSGRPFVHIDEVVSRFNDAGRSSHRDPSFEALKLKVIRESFGLPFYLAKRARSALVSLLKPRVAA
jgi:glycosyltransferase involved in cell wall biosynthesis